MSDKSAIIIKTKLKLELILLLYSNLNQTDTKHIDYLMDLIVDQLELMDDPKVTKSIRVLNINDENILKNQTSINHYINFIVRGQNDWCLQIGKNECDHKNGVKYIKDTNSSYYINTDGLLSVDDTTGTKIEHCREQRVANDTTTSVFDEELGWIEKIDHTTIYFQDLTTHDIKITKDKTHYIPQTNPKPKTRSLNIK